MYSYEYIYIFNLNRQIDNSNVHTLIYTPIIFTDSGACLFKECFYTMLIWSNVSLFIIFGVLPSQNIYVKLGYKDILLYFKSFNVDIDIFIFNLHMWGRMNFKNSFLVFESG